MTTKPAKKAEKGKAPSKAELVEALVDAVSKGGRPTLYKAEFVEQARKLCLLGATDQEIADFFGVDVRTVYRWKGDHEEFCQALRVGKEEADARVVRSLFQQAIGYEQDQVKIFMPANAEKPVYAHYREKVAPSATAGIFWLKNRDPDKWRDKQDVEHSGNVSVTRKVFKTDA